MDCKNIISKLNKDELKELKASIDGALKVQEDKNSQKQKQIKLDSLRDKFYGKEDDITREIEELREEQRRLHYCESFNKSKLYKLTETKTFYVFAENQQEAKQLSYDVSEDIIPEESIEVADFNDLKQNEDIDCFEDRYTKAQLLQVLSKKNEYNKLEKACNKLEKTKQKLREEFEKNYKKINES